MDILAVKRKLNELGFAKPVLDDTNPSYGPRTVEAVKAFQKAKGLQIDGQVGPKTLDALQLNQYIYQLSSIESAENVDSTVLCIRAMQWAISQNGVKEMTGRNDGPAVETFLRSVGLGKGNSWCCAFVYWCYEQASLDLHVSNPLFKTGHVLTLRNNRRGNLVSNPRPGDLFYLDLGESRGHIGFVVRVEGDRIVTVEGNTNLNGSANGDGVYYPRTRRITSVAGFLRF